MTENALTTLTAALRRADGDGRIDLAGTLVRMLTAAGMVSEWDSETIEDVLEPAEDVLAVVGAPWVGDTGVDDAGLEYWQEIAHELGWG